jgi:EamA-like transporter family
MEAASHRPTWKILLAFAIIYFVWGSTFLAIRVGVREVPPFLLAAMRFLIAGAVLYGWTIARGELALETYTTSDMADLPSGLEFEHDNTSTGPGNEELITSQESDLQKHANS